MRWNLSGYITGLDRRHHGQGFDIGQIVSQPVDDFMTMTPERLGIHMWDIGHL